VELFDVEVFVHFQLRLSRTFSSVGPCLNLFFGAADVALDALLLSLADDLLTP
jgi:hypothetical protein